MNAILDISRAEKKVDDFELGPINLQIEPATITAIAGGITLLGQLTNCNRYSPFTGDKLTQSLLYPRIEMKPSF